MNKTVVIFGPTSAIARATAISFAKQGYDIYLAGRDEEELKRIASDLTIRFNIHVYQGIFEAEKINTHEKFFKTILKQTGEIAGVVIAFGYMTNSAEMHDLHNLQKLIAINFTGAASILTICANYFESCKQGFIIGITSVAGDRGRQSNYVYGAAKGGLNVFLQGLRNRLYPSGVRVITVKPGFVDTAMTFGLPGLFLVASPEIIGEKIATAPQKKQDIIYLPWFWRYIMLIIKSIPEPLFKRLKL
jgi:decaprenylphospho-beta-D-erythro-pentofuranosid-2-ulose 2-reductase